MNNMRFAEEIQILKEMNLLNSPIDFSEQGECTKCGECCSNLLPVGKDEISKIKKYMRLKKIKLIAKNYPVRNEFIDMTCPFLGYNQRCAIYEIRPLICKIFLCSKTMEETYQDALVLKKVKDMKVIDMRNTFAD